MKQALLAIFRPRNIENKDSKEGSVEKCELKLLHPSDDALECQLLIRLVCKHGVRKTYKLQYEQTQTMHAITDKTTSLNRFSLPAPAMKNVTDHFAPRAEEITLTVEDGSLLLTSFTEGIRNDKEILKQPIHTSVSIDAKEFLTMEVDEDIRITFGLREFRAVVSLGDVLSTDLELCYGDSGRPMIVEFEKEGLIGEFVVATTADDDSNHTRASEISRKAPAGRFQARVVNQNPSGIRTSREPAESSAMPAWHDSSVLEHSANGRSSPIMQDNHKETSELVQNRTNIPMLDDTPLFAPDHDQTPAHGSRSRQARHQNHLDYGKQTSDSRVAADTTVDPDVYRLTHAYAHEASLETDKDLADDFGDDEMELFEDEGVFADETEEVLGPTQGPGQKHKSIFD